MYDRRPPPHYDLTLFLYEHRFAFLVSKRLALKKNLAFILGWGLQPGAFLSLSPQSSPRTA